MQVFPLNLFDIDVVEGDRSKLKVVAASQQFEHGGLAGTTLPHERNVGPWGHYEVVQVKSHFARTGVGELHPTKFYLDLARLELESLLAVDSGSAAH
jgi:hypothetical protein